MISGTSTVRRRLRALPVCLAALFACVWSLPGKAEANALWQALKTDGHIALIRHALAPGTGDPAHFELGTCGTQRNLSDEGRRQARRIGARFRDNGLASVALYSSQWCRCLDTARAMDLGPVSELSLLNSFFRDRQRGPAQTEALRGWLSGQDLARPLVLVTHQVNITALTGVYPASGEMVILRRNTDGTLETVGTIRTD